MSADGTVNMAMWVWEQKCEVEMWGWGRADMQKKNTTGFAAGTDGTDSSAGTCQPEKPALRYCGNRRYFGLGNIHMIGFTTEMKNCARQKIQKYKN